MLDDQNAILPTGQALALWGRYLKSNLLALQSEAGAVYATYEPSTRVLTLFLMNKHTAPHSIQLDLTHIPAQRIVYTVFTGQHPADENPTLSAPEPAPVSTALTLTLPPLSITILDLEA